jgi:hypothetical protein
MKKVIISIFFITCFGLSAVVFAQNLDKKFEVGFSGGYYAGVAEEDGNIRIRDERIRSYEKLIGKYTTNLQSDPIFYLNGAYRFKDYGFFRLQVGYAEYNIEIDRDMFRKSSDELVGKLDFMPIAANFNYFLMRKTPFKPYISAGFTGYYLIDSKEISMSPTARIGADFGVGFEYYFTDAVAFNMDIGYHFLKIEVNPEEPFQGRGYPETYEEFNVIPDRVEATIGLKFLVY